MTTSTNSRTASVTIRQASDDDFASIATLLTENGLPVDGVEEAICGFLVAEAEQRIVGVVGMEYCGSYGLLRSTAVDRAWRGQHVARHLVERIIAEAEARGVRALYLLTTTAEHYFPSFGFATVSRDAVPEPIRQTDEFRGACPASAVAMTLCLDGATPSIA